MVKPILFNTEMVRAILDGRKSCTRRKIPTDIVDYCDVETDGSLLSYENHYGDFIKPENLCRYQPGDILYVRETWHKGLERYIYRADYSDAEKFYRDGKEINMKWHPSLHMPKEAARLFLRVTNVRVERLQDITEDGAKAEGSIDNRGFIHSPDNEYDRIHTAKENFIEIWNRTIKKSDLDFYGWDANPYVWVIEFERCDKPESEE